MRAHEVLPTTPAWVAYCWLGKVAHLLCIEPLLLQLRGWHHDSCASHSVGLGVLPPPTSLVNLPTFSPLPTPQPVTLSQALSVPAKISKKILDLEYVEMHELLPDSWLLQEEDSRCCHQRRSNRRGPVTDILIWIECYSSLVAILSTKYPDKTPQLMSYMRTIVKSQRTFSGEGWVSYDTCFRRKAAISKSLEWGVIDFTLYNETFTGRAKAMARCRYCSSDMHTSQDCVYAPTTAQSSGSSWSHPSAQRPEKDKPLCQLFNARTNRCPFNPCRFRHNCAECDGRHPRSLCRRNAPPEKIPRVDYRAKKR